MISALLADCLFLRAEPSPEEKLQKLHTDIKFALRVDNPVSRTSWFLSSLTCHCCVGTKTHCATCYFQDIDRCLQALDELNAIPVTSQILHKNAEVIATLKKVHLHVSNPNARRRCWRKPCLLMYRIRSTDSRQHCVFIITLSKLLEIQVWLHANQGGVQPLWNHQYARLCVLLFQCYYWLINIMNYAHM